MKAAVLCPGPSLARVTPLRLVSARVVIGVNRAADAFFCDYAVALDCAAVGHMEPRGDPMLVTTSQVERQARRLRRGSLRWLEICGDWLHVPGLHWHTKSLGVALALTNHLGADIIQCYGVDWAGEADWDGFRHGREQRSPQRWSAEAELIGRVVAALASRGRTVLGLPQEVASGP